MKKILKKLKNSFHSKLSHKLRFHLVVILRNIVSLKNGFDKKVDVWQNLENTF